MLLYREELHVPLLVKLPRERRAGERVDAPVGLVDVAPTVLDLTGTGTPDGLSGRSLLSSGPVRRIYGETFYPRYHFGWSDLASLDGQSVPGTFTGAGTSFSTSCPMRPSGATSRPACLRRFDRCTTS